MKNKEKLLFTIEFDEPSGGKTILNGNGLELSAMVADAMKQSEDVGSIILSAVQFYFMDKENDDGE